MKERSQFVVERMGVAGNWLWLPAGDRRRASSRRGVWFEGARSRAERGGRRLSGIDAALEEREVIAAADEVQANAVEVVADGVVSAVVVPEFGVGERISAQEPVGVDEGGDEERLLGSGGFPAEEVFMGKGAEFRGVLAGDDLGAGIEAGFEGVGTGGGLAMGGARARGFWELRRLAAISESEATLASRH